MAKIVGSYNDFTFNLYRNVVEDETSNVFYSPYSIMVAMSMCTAGARNNTEKQLKQVLSYGNLSNDDVHKGNAELQQYLSSLGQNVSLNIANKIFQKDSFVLREEYLDLLRKFYNSDAQGMDFSNAAASAKIINDWVEAQTKNKIQNLVPSSVITPLTQLILINAIYFRGNWEIQFDKDKTVDSEFHSGNNTKKSVKMMALTGKRINILADVADLPATACRLPYVGGQLSMTIVLPHEGTKISQIESKLNANTMKQILTFQRNVKVNVFIPKFKFEQQFELSDVLAKMGAPDAFDGKADFTGMKSPNSGLYISNVIHKAIVEVNEEGTEAAAATAVVMMKRSARIEHIEEFRCDRPFLFFIHDNQHNTILFAGRYATPV